VTVEELIVDVAVEQQHVPAAAAQYELVDDANTEQVRDDLRRAIVIAANPNDLEVVGEFADQREDLPVALLEPAEGDGVKHVAIEDEPGRRQRPIDNLFEQLAQRVRQAVVAPEVQVGQDDGVEHSETSPPPGQGDTGYGPARRRVAGLSSRQEHLLVDENLS